jgi:hypothetical protein
MTRTLLLAAAALSVVATGATADAASRHKHKYYRHHHGAWVAPGSYGPGYGTWQAPVGMRTPGPPWAMPNECYTDEGYGRYSSCDRRR